MRYNKNQFFTNLNVILQLALLLISKHSGAQKFYSDTIRTGSFLCEKSHRLHGVIIQITRAGSAMECNFTCLQFPRCISFNLRYVTRTAVDCEMLATDRYNSTAVLSASAVHSHYFIQVCLKFSHFSRLFCRNFWDR